MEYQKNIIDYLMKHGYEALSLKAVLFDMDGVLFNSMPLHEASWRQVGELYHLPVTAREVYQNEGRTGASTIRLLARQAWGRTPTPDEVDAIYSEKCRLFSACPPPPPMPGAAALLAQVRRAGLSVYVVTGSGQHSLLNRLSGSFPGSFDAAHVISSKDVTHGKPSPEPYERALLAADASPDEAIVVENAPLGVCSAVAAGIFTIAVNTGPLPDEDLYSAGANLLLPSMQALADAWPQFMETVRNVRC